MIYSEDGTIKTEEGEPVMRSCWRCNKAHEHLKTVNSLHACFRCCRLWVFDKFLGSFDDSKALAEWLMSKGVKPGQSTREVDAGYRIMSITFEVSKS